MTFLWILTLTITFHSGQVIINQSGFNSLEQCEAIGKMFVGIKDLEKSVDKIEYICEQP